MRRHCLAVSLALLAACGGSDPVSPPPPPPPPGPPQPGPPASAAVVAGDGQTGAPGSKVPIRPGVVVRDAGNRPVPGIAVTFAVDAGGGQVEGANAVTGTDGVATAGDWTLGPSEGVNRLQATSGSLTPVTISAQGTHPTVVLADVTVGPGGGTIVVQKPGDPLNGTRLVIPAGAFSTTGQWRLESRPAATGPSLPSSRIVAPVLQIFTDQGLADSAMFLTLPVSVAADSFLTLFLRDPVSGRLEAMPPVTIGASSITVAARHFAPDRLLGLAAPGAAPPHGATGPSFLQVVASGTTLASLAGGITTGFTPGTDDWEFPNHGTYLTPAGNRIGSSLSALYYFHTNGIQALGLSGKFDQGAFWADNPQGVRVAALAESAIDWIAAGRYAISINNGAAASGFGSIDAANLYTMAAAMTVTRQPQLIVGLGPQPQGMYGLIAYQADQTGITAVDPNNPGVALRIPFTNTKFQPVPLGPFTGAPTSQFFLAQTLGASSVIDASALATLFSQAAAGTAGSTAFPQYRLQYYDEETTQWFDLTTTTLQLSWQDVQIRAICTGCARSIVSLTQNGLQGVDIYNSVAQQLATDRTAGFARFRVPANGKVGIHVLGGYPCTSCANEWRHLDFKYITIQATRIVITPNPLAGDVGQPVTFTAKNLDLGTPAGATYQWDFGNGTTATVTGDSSVTKTYNVAGTYTVKVKVKTPAGQTYGQASSTAAINAPLPIWRFVTMGQIVSGPSSPDGFNILQGYIQQDIGALMEPIRAVPGAGRLFYHATPVTVGAQTFPAGVYVMGGYSSSGDFTFNPAWPFAPLARPFQGGYPDAFVDGLVLDAATQAGSLNSGTFSGTSATRTRDLTIFAQFGGATGVHTVTHWEVTATKSGTQMTGKITYYLEQWVPNIPTCNPPASLACAFMFGGTLKWEFPFTAERVR